MLSLIQPISLFDKKVLVTFIQENLDALEEGLQFLARHLGDEDSGYIDLFACDSYGRSVIIDVSLKEPSPSLFEALNHFVWVKRQLPFLQQIYDEHSLRINHPPKIFLVAPSFSYKIINLCSELSLTTVKLFEFRYLKMEEQTGILLSSIDTPAVHGTISSYELNLKPSAPLGNSIELSEMELQEFLELNIPPSPTNGPFSK